MKLFLLLLGLLLTGLGLLFAPMVFGAEGLPQGLAMIMAGMAGFGAVAAAVVVGLIAVFVAGCMFGKGPGEIELPEKCPACRAEMSRTFICPECEHDSSPPRWALDTFGMIGSFLALAAAGVVAGAPFFLNNPKLVAIIFLAALSAAAVSLLMGLGSLIAERRSIAKAVTGVILSAVALAFSIFLVI